VIPMPTLRQVRTPDLTRHELASIRSLCDAVWGGPDEPFGDEDWQHALGGVHVFIQEDGDVIAHGSVVPRTLHTCGLDLATGYVEAVATLPAQQGRGHGTQIMRAVGAYIDRSLPLGALCTGAPGFYQRLGWLLWEGPTSVRTNEGEEGYRLEDGAVLVRLTPSSPPTIDLTTPISCDWRPGDAW
jgi:aminoglycoside 2'-N-acetyltransferase I